MTDYYHFPNIQDPCPFNVNPNYKDEFLSLQKTQTHLRQNLQNFRNTQRVAYEPSDNLLPRQYSQYKECFSLSGNNWRNQKNNQQNLTHQNQLQISQMTQGSLYYSQQRPVSVDNQLIAQKTFQENFENQNEVQNQNSRRQMIQTSNQEKRAQNLNSYKPEPYRSPQTLNQKKLREIYTQNSQTQNKSISQNNLVKKQSLDPQNTLISTATTFNKSFTNNFNISLQKSKNSNFAQQQQQQRQSSKKQTQNQNLRQKTELELQDLDLDQVQSYQVNNMNFRPKKRYFQSENVSPQKIQKPKYVYQKFSPFQQKSSLKQSKNRKSFNKNDEFQNQHESKKSITQEKEQKIAINNNKLQLQLQQQQQQQQKTKNSNFVSESNTSNNQLYNQTTTHMTKSTKNNGLYNNITNLDNSKNNQDFQKTYGFISPINNSSNQKKLPKNLQNRSSSINCHPSNQNQKIRSVTQTNFSNNLIAHNNNILKSMTSSKQSRNLGSSNLQNSIANTENNKILSPFINKYSYNKTNINSNNSNSASNNMSLYSNILQSGGKQNSSRYQKYSLNQYYSNPFSKQQQQQQQSSSQQNQQQSNKKVIPLKSLNKQYNQKQKDQYYKYQDKQQKQNKKKIINAYDIGFSDISLKQQNPNIVNSKKQSQKSAELDFQLQAQPQQDFQCNNEQLTASQQFKALNNRYDDNFDETDPAKKKQNGIYELI